MGERPLIPSAIAKQIEDWEMWKIQAWRDIGYDEGFRACLDKASLIASDWAMMAGVQIGVERCYGISEGMWGAKQDAANDIHKKIEAIRR